VPESDGNRPVSDTIDIDCANFHQLCRRRARLRAVSLDSGCPWFMTVWRTVITRSALPRCGRLFGRRRRTGKLAAESRFTAKATVAARKHATPRRGTPHGGAQMMAITVPIKRASSWRGQAGCGDRTHAVAEAEFG